MSEVSQLLWNSRGSTSKHGDLVAVKAWRSFVLETVTVDLSIIRNWGLALWKSPQVGLLNYLDQSFPLWRTLHLLYEVIIFSTFIKTKTLRFRLMAKDPREVYIQKSSCYRVDRRRKALSHKVLKVMLDRLLMVGVICYRKQVLHWCTRTMHRLQVHEHCTRNKPPTTTQLNKNMFIFVF